MSFCDQIFLVINTIELEQPMINFSAHLLLFQKMLFVHKCVNELIRGLSQIFIYFLFDEIV